MGGEVHVGTVCVCGCVCVGGGGEIHVITRCVRGWGVRHKWVGVGVGGEA